MYSLTEMIKWANIEFPFREEEIAEYCHTIYSNCLIIGMILGPILSSFLSSSVSYSSSQDTIALINMTFYCLYFIMVGAQQSFKNVFRFITYRKDKNLHL